MKQTKHKKKKLTLIRGVIKDACELCTHKNTPFKKFIALLVHIVTFGKIKYAHRLDHNGLFGKTQEGRDFELIEKMTTRTHS